MALIHCPECGKEFSEFAVSCPNCGMPTNKIEEKVQSNRKCDVILQYMKPMYLGVFSQYLEDKLQYGIFKGMKIGSELPSYICEDVDYSFAKEIENDLRQFECQVKIVDHAIGVERAGNLVKNRCEEVHCPRCGSTAITTTSRGFSVWTGFWGAGKTVNRCAKCGNTWQPK